MHDAHTLGLKVVLDVLLGLVGKDRDWTGLGWVEMVDLVGVVELGGMFGLVGVVELDSHLLEIMCCIFCSFSQ